MSPLLVAGPPAFNCGEHRKVSFPGAMVTVKGKGFDPSVPNRMRDLLGGCPYRFVATTGNASTAAE